jgi:hypothetical protein
VVGDPHQPQLVRIAVRLHRLFLLAAALAAGCTDPASDPNHTTSPPPTPSAPALAVRLTDAPAELDQVWVDIGSVEIESAADGWRTLTDGPQRFDLLTLQNDVTAALGGATLTAGAYGQLRLVVDSAEVVTGGVTEPLRIASGAQTGIKIALDTTFEDDMTYTLVLDFDAARSVKHTGQGWLMTPVIEVASLTATPVVPPDDPAPDIDAGTPEPDAEDNPID